MTKEREESFAIIRVDEFLDPSAALPNRIKVTKVVSDEQTAKAEVERLNQLHPGKEVVYFWQKTHIDPSPKFPKLQWLHKGRILAGQLKATRPGQTAWVGIYPLDLANPCTHDLLRTEGVRVAPSASARVYRIQCFEIADELRETYFSDRDMWSRIVVGDDALLAALEERGISPDVLDLPWRVDYPL